MSAIDEKKINAYDVERDGMVWVRYRCPGCNTEWAYDKKCDYYNFCPKCGKEVVLRYGTDDDKAMPILRR